MRVSRTSGVRFAERDDGEPAVIGVKTPNSAHPMKTLRITLLALAAAAATSAALAGPGIEYWNARRADRDAAKSESAAKPEAAKCDRMVVKHGKRTTTVECTGATAETAQCKAACGM